MDLGGWATEKEAAQAYDRAARFYLGTRAPLNFHSVQRCASRRGDTEGGGPERSETHPFEPVLRRLLLERVEG